MTDKRKKRIREHAARTGMSYQAAANALSSPRECRCGHGREDHSPEEPYVCLVGDYMRPCPCVAFRELAGGEPRP
jgi:hypothetical protein